MFKVVPNNFLAALAMTLAGLALGCSSSGGSRNLMWDSKDIETSAEELRIRVRALAGPFTGIMEEAADNVMALSDDPYVLENALLFKINAIPVMQSALFQRDPLAALFDAWAYIFQMREFWEHGLSADLTPEELAIGTRALDRMESQIERVAATASTSSEAVDQARQNIQVWAAENPMTTGFHSRPPTTGDLAAFTAESKPGLRRTAASLTETMDDLTTRIDVYAAFLPKQARWQAELLLGQAVGTVGLDGVFGSVTSMAESFDAIARTVEQAPGLVEKERTAVLKALQEERIAVLGTLHQEFVQAYEFITAERLAVVREDLHNERVATLEALTDERIAVMEVLRQERAATMEDLEQLAADITENTLEGVVDHFILRVVQVGLVLILVIALVAILVLRLGIRRKAA